MFRFLPLALAGFGLVSAVAPAAAQSALTPVSVTIQRYDEITASDGDAGMACCAPQIYESGPTADFFHVRMVFDVAFSESLDRVSISGNDITLLVPGAADGLRAIGRYGYIGIFEDGSPTIFARRPRDWPAQTEQAFLEGVWLVPEGVTSATLQLGEEAVRLQVPIDLNVAPGQPVSPGQTLQAVVTGFSAEAALPANSRMGGQEVAGRVVPTSGQALRIDLTVTPLMSTATDAQVGENQFFMYAEHFALVGPDGLPLTYLGFRSDDTLRSRWSISSTWDNAPRASALPLYFLGNPVAGTYTVYYLHDPVAQFTLQ